MATLEDQIQQELKCRAFKNEENPDGRESLCGEPVKFDSDGRQFFEVPGHQKEYLSKLLPSYTFSETFRVGTEPKEPRKSRKSRE